MKDIIQVIKQETESLKAEMWHSKKVLLFAKPVYM